MINYSFRKQPLMVKVTVFMIVSGLLILVGFRKENLFTTVKPQSHETSLISNDSPSLTTSTESKFNKPDTEQAKAGVLENFAKQPIHFEPNVGQVVDENIRFTSHGPGYNLFLSSSEATLLLSQAFAPKPTGDKNQTPIPNSFNRPQKNQKFKQTTVSLKIVGAKQTATSLTLEEQTGKSNYYLGSDPHNWQSDVPNYGRVRFEEVYDGIDLEYYGNQQQLEYDFIVKPQANPEMIKLQFNGVKNIKVDEQSGELVLKTALGEIRQKKPFVYQTDEQTGEKQEIESLYKVKGREVTFGFGEFDRQKPLVIDPVVLVYSTYHGGINNDWGNSVAVDSAGNAYITGWTLSPTGFPLLNARQTTFGGGTTYGDAFISKFSPTGVLLYSTYHGGSADDIGEAVAVDSSGNAYITGETASISGFPLLNARQTTFGGGTYDGFVSKFSPTGVLLYSTYHGGNATETTRGIGVDAAGNAYIAGFTTSTTGFPLLNARQTTNSGSNDGFVSKFSPTGVLLYSTYHGGTGNDGAERLAVDSAGNAYIIGFSTSTAGFPLLNARQTTYGGGAWDAFVSKFSPTGVLLYSTYHGGTDYDVGWGIAVDSAGNAYLSGQTTSTQGFPLLNARQATYGGATFDAFVSKFNPNGVLLFSTYHGGSGNENALGAAVDAGGNVYISGWTNSTTGFPLLNASQTVFGGVYDSFLSKLSPNGGLVYSTFYGGSGDDEAFGVAVDSVGNAYVTGYTGSTTDFPLLNARQTTFGGGGIDAFIAKFADFPAPTFTVSGQVTAGTNPLNGVTVSLTSNYLSRTTVTNASGNFQFPAVPPDNYNLRPVLEGAAFTPPIRTVTVTGADVLNQNFAITSCNYSLSTNSTNVSSARTQLIFGILTTGECRWTGASNVNWIVLLTDETGNGNGSVTFVVQRNYGAARSGTIVVNGQLLTVNQAAGQAFLEDNPDMVDPCPVSFTVNSVPQTRQVVPFTGLTGSFTVNTPAGCNWSAEVPGSNGSNSWLTVTSGATGTGPQVVNFSAAEHSGNVPRRRDIRVLGRSFTVIQTAAQLSGCNFGLTPTSANFGTGGGTGSFNISLSPLCRWDSLTGDPWVIRDGNTNGFGNGTQNYSILANTDADARTGTITVGDQAFTINQTAGQTTSCSYQLSSNGQSYTATAGTGSFTVTAGNGCPWTATRSADATWITLDGADGTGNGTVSFSMQANSSNVRTGVITINGQTFTVTQASPTQSCTYTINPAFQSVPAEGVTGNVQVTATSGCQPWTAQSDVNWLRVLSPTTSTTGNGQVTFIAETNNTVATRTGRLTIAGQTFTATQEGNPNVTIPVTVQTNPVGRSFTVDGTTYTTTQTFNWTPGTNHVIATTSPQAGATGTQYVWANWSDGGAISHTVAPTAGATYTANFTTQYQLTMTAGAGGTVSPPTGFYNAGQTVNITATANSGFSFNGWMGTGTGSYTGTNNPASVTMNGPITETAAFAPTVSVTIQANPAGRSFTVDGTTYTTPQTFNWTPGSSHTIATTSPQAGTAGTQYVWANWSDGGAISHTVAPTTATTYTANFTTQYQLTMASNPTTGGTVSPANGFYNAGQTVSISATPNAGLTFSGWTGTGSGSYTGNNNPASITMNGPITETAAFTAQAAVTVQTNPVGRSFMVDGTTYTTTQIFNWNPGSTHTIATTTPQAGATGTQYVWANWSDGGAISHTVAPTSAATYTANFTTQYQLTMIAGNGGTVSPASGNWYNAGQTVSISATPNSGFTFNNWTGTGTGSYSGTNNPANVTMNAPITETASFSTVQCTYSINPTSQSFSVTGGTGQIQVTAPSGCPWTAAVNPFGPSLISTDKPLFGDEKGRLSGLLTTEPGQISPNQTKQSPEPKVKDEKRLSSDTVAVSFSNPTPINIADSDGTSPGIGSPYPSTITVSGLTGTVTDVNVTLRGLTHTFPDDIGLLLVSPDGTRRMVIQSDVGGGTDVSAVTYTLDDQAAAGIPNVGPLVAGTFLPSSVGDDDLFPQLGTNPPPVTCQPAGSCPQAQPAGTATLNGTFGGINPNGVWKLYAIDCCALDIGGYSGGWTIDITTQGGPWLTITSGQSGTGNGTINYSVAANSTGQFRSGTMTIGGNTFTVNQAGSVRRSFDYDGDGKTDLSVFRPSNGTWWLNQSSNGSTKVYQFGQATDKIAPADYTGDGKTDVAFFRNGTWFILRSENETFYAAPFGTTGDIPAPGDFDGDGRADLAVFRPTAATWFIFQSATQTDRTIQFGANGDIPVVGDYDGDAKADIAIFRPSNGTWWLNQSSNGNTKVYQFGSGTDKVAQADYTGDGKTDVAFFRNGNWFILRSENETFYSAPFGTAGDIPTAGDYDGDGQADLAVFRPTVATWFILRSTQGTLIQQFGTNGDIPTSAAYIP